MDARPHRGRLRRARRQPGHGSTGFLREGERVIGVQVQDLETGREFEVRAKQVINATGVWTDDTQAMVGERGQFHVRASKGIHLVVPRDRIQSSTGLILRTEKTVLFVIPWGRHWIIGTTDTDWNLDKAHPAATAADIDYLLDHVNAVLDHAADPRGRRGRVRRAAAAAGRRVGEHVEAVPRARRRAPVPGLVVVAGGKYTTYRVMAEGRRRRGRARLWTARVPASVTENVPLVGADGYHALWNQRHLIAAALRPARGPDRAPARTATAR